MIHLDVTIWPLRVIATRLPHEEQREGRPPWRVRVTNLASGQTKIICLPDDGARALVTDMFSTGKRFTKKTSEILRQLPSGLQPSPRMLGA